MPTPRPVRVLYLISSLEPGGAEYYLMEQEGSRLSEMETAKACLDAYKKVRA